MSREPSRKKAVSHPRRTLLFAIPAVILLFSLASLLVSYLLLQSRSTAHESEPVLLMQEMPESAAPSSHRLQIKAYSSGGDLYAVLHDPEHDALPEASFVYTLVFPDGTLQAYPAEEDGTLYLTGLVPGLYTLRLNPGEGWTSLPAAIEVLPPPSLPVSENRGWTEAEGLTYYFDSSGNLARGIRQIDGKLYYFNLFGVKAAKLGIDISYHNKGVNWPAVKANGIDFAILRVGYRGWESGLLWLDDRFVQNLRGAKAAGLDVGVYVYSTAVNPIEARQEADLIVGMLGGMELEYPVFFDTEQSGDYPLGRADRLPKPLRAQIVRAFCDRVRDAGYTPGVYSGINFLNNHISRFTYAPYYTWLANYTRRNRLPDFPYPYDMWQFTDAGHVNGIRGVVDMNVVY